MSVRCCKRSGRVPITDPGQRRWQRHDERATVTDLSQPYAICSDLQAGRSAGTITGLIVKMTYAKKPNWSSFSRKGLDEKGLLRYN
jgi:hypothetical protein